MASLPFGALEPKPSRYITPFRRRLGRWLTPATTLMPLLTDSKSRACIFSVSSHSPGWVNSFKLRFSGSATVDGPPPAVRDTGAAQGRHCCVSSQVCLLGGGAPGGVGIRCAMLWLAGEGAML